jgi:hypothetical protein
MRDIENTNARFKSVKLSKVYSNNFHKIKQNTLFINKIKSIQKVELNKINNDCFVGTLDSIEENTTKLLTKNGLKKSNILIVESNEKIGKLHEDNGIPCHIGDLESFADDENDKVYSEKNNNWRKYLCIGWNFDTCGHVTTQGKQILAVVNKTCFASGCVLAFTFCRSRKTKENHNKDYHDFQKKLTLLLKKKNMSLKKVTRYLYSGDGNGNRGALMDWSMFIVG